MSVKLVEIDPTPEEARNWRIDGLQHVADVMRKVIALAKSPEECVQISGDMYDVINLIFQEGALATAQVYNITEVPPNYRKDMLAICGELCGSIAAEILRKTLQDQMIVAATKASGNEA